MLIDRENWLRLSRLELDITRKEALILSAFCSPSFFKWVDYYLSRLSLRIRMVSSETKLEESL